MPKQATTINRARKRRGVAPLGETEMRLVCGEGSFGYMKEHKEVLEMYPPHVLAPDSSHFARGTPDRHRDVPDVVRRRMMGWCRGELEDGRFPFDRFYPDREGKANGGRARPGPLGHGAASEPQT